MNTLQINNMKSQLCGILYEVTFSKRNLKNIKCNLCN